MGWFRRWRVGRGSTLVFLCNICGARCKAKLKDLSRESGLCSVCESTVRMRAIIHMLSIELFGKSLILPNFPGRPEIRGVGMSDWDGYAIPLAQKLGYTNTFYHQEPRLDITAINPSLEGTLDFIISSDVFEHIVPPVSIAFENARKLLKPNGVLIFTVPYSADGQTQEHFPDLYQYEVVKINERHILKNRTKDGKEQVFNDLVFHGGLGTTLEMRVFSESNLIEEFNGAGFKKVKLYSDAYLEHGIYWIHPWSLGITARIN